MFGQEKVIDLLLENKANPNIYDKNNWTSLSFAWVLNHLKIKNLLITHGAKEIEVKYPRLSSEKQCLELLSSPRIN